MHLPANIKARLIIFLRRCERITGTDNIYLAKNSTYLILTQAVNVLNGLILYTLIGHFLPQHVYGQYKYFLNLFSLMAIFGLTGLETAMIRSIAQGKDGAIVQGFHFKLLGGLIGSCFCLLTAGYYLLQGRTDLAWGLALLALFTPFIYAANVYPAYLQGKKRFDAYSWLVIRTTIISCLIMAIAFIFLKNPIQLFGAFLISSLPVFFVYLKKRPDLPIFPQDDALLKYGSYLSSLEIFGTIATNIDGVIIFHFLGAKELAVYSLAIIPVEQIKGFLKTFQSIAMPKFATASLSALKRGLQRKLLLLTALVLAITAAYIALAPTFFHIFFPRYAASVPYTQAYVVSLIFVMPAAMLGTVFQVKALKKEHAAFNIISYTLQIALLIIGTWQYGIWGAIVSRIITRAGMLCLTLTLFHQSAEPQSA